MISPRWHKVLKDLWINKTRTMLVVLSIAVGVFAIGVIINARMVLSRSLTETYEATDPAHATFLTMTSFQPELADSVRNVDGVEEAEARRSVVVRLQTGTGEWLNLQLQAIPDYADIRVSRVRSESGVWPPRDHDVLIERSALPMTGVNVGDIVTIKTPAGRERQVRIVGLSHDLQASMYILGGIAYGHINADMLEWLGEERNFNELHVRVTQDAIARGQFDMVINDVQDKIERSGHPVLFTLVQPPGQLPANYIVQAILAILGAVGVLALILGSFLVVNTTSAILTQQVQQIGIMKSFGARTRQLVGMYLLMVFVYGILALIVALPLSSMGAYSITLLIGKLLNFDLTTFTIAPGALVAQALVALLVPLAASLLPVLSGTRVTVHQAIMTQGVGQGTFGTGLIDRFLTSSSSQRLLRFFDRPTIISLRNTVRRKSRLLLTLFTLTLAGTAFITIVSLQASLRSTLNSWLAYYQYDVAIQLGRPYRVVKVKNVLERIPGVVAAEGLGYTNARRARPDGTDSGNISVYATPPQTNVINPTIVAGRWLLPEDENAIVLSTMVLRDDPDIDLGDEILLKIEGKKEPWTVVGFAQGGSPLPTAFVSYDWLARVVNEVGKAEYIMVVTDNHSAEAQIRMSSIIETYLTQAGIRVGMAAPAELDKQAVAAIFQIVFVLLLIVTSILATVGGLGLMGTMSINVLERTIEMGVMRAIGASTVNILQIVVVEGMLMGAISWLIAATLAIPLSRILSDLIGEMLLSSTLDYQFSIGGAFVWLVLVLMLAAIASFIPAMNAARVSVREVLAYV
jgi:putative ABC transport system permease protein